MEIFDGKQSNWEGLWFHPENNGFTSAVISLAKLKAFKGNIRLYVKKNKYYNGGENGRPNYHFCIRSANSPSFKFLDIENDASYKTEDSEEELYTRDEVMTIIHGVVRDVQCGYTDLLPEDYV